MKIIFCLMVALTMVSATGCIFPGGPGHHGGHHGGHGGGHSGHHEENRDDHH